MWLVLPTLNRYQSARYAAIAGRGGLAGVFEISGMGSYDVPGWRSPTADDLPGVVTLFRSTSYFDIGARTLRRVLTRALDERRQAVRALAVLGWDDTSSLTGLSWAAARRVPVVMLSDSNVFDSPRMWLRESLKRAVVSLASAGIAAGSNAEGYLLSLGMRRESIFRGYDVVDNDHFSEGAAKARSRGRQMRARLGLPDRYFLACGRLVEKKNWLALLDAYRSYRDALTRGGEGDAGRDGWHLVIVGDGPMRGRVEESICDGSLRGWAHLAGFVAYEQMPAYYGLASAFVHASRVEQWGLVINEAMASGLPVLVSNRCGCAADLVVEGENGFTFDPEDERELAKLFSAISSMPAGLLDQMRSRSEAIIGQWSLETLAESFLNAVDVATQPRRRQQQWFARMVVKLLLTLRR